MTSSWDLRPPDRLDAAIADTPCDLISDPGAAELEWTPAGQDWQDVALQLRLLLSRGTSLAIATVVGMRGAVIRPPGTVLVVTEAGETIGFNPAGPLDGAIRDLAGQALATGQDKLQRLRIEQDAAGYIGLSGQISLDIHAMRVDAADPAFGAMLRYLDSGAAAVLIIGTRGVAECAVVGADRVVGQPDRPSLPSPVIQDARHMLGCHRTASRTYRPGGEKAGTGIRVWMASYPQA
jgi:xanthine dehydrogenase accessory factor